MCGAVRDWTTKMRTFLFFTCLVAYLGTAVQQESPDEYYNGQGVNPDIAQSKTEHQGGTVVADQIFFTKDRSPYWLRNDLIIERQAEMIIEPGVIIKVEPQVGITVRGTLTAVVCSCCDLSKGCGVLDNYDIS